MEILNNMYKFTDTDSDVSGSWAYKTLKLAEEGNYKEFKKMYKDMCKTSVYADKLQVGIARVGGYEFDFTPFLKRFLIRDKYDGYYHVIFALNKTNIFDNLYISRSSVVDILDDTRHTVLT